MSSGFFTILSEKCSVALWNLKRSCKSCWIQIHFILWRKNATCCIRRLNEMTWKKQRRRYFWHLEGGRLRAKMWAYKIIVTRRVKYFVFDVQVECQYLVFIIQIQFQNLWLLCIWRHHSYIFLLLTYLHVVGNPRMHWKELIENINSEKEFIKAIKNKYFSSQICFMYFLCVSE